MAKAFRLELNLSKICMISLSKSFFDIEDVKLEIKNLFKNKENKDAIYEKVIPSVLNHSEGLLARLPSKLRTELENVILFIGEEIYSWIYYLIEKLDLDVSTADEIYFTPFGQIDESQIFQKYWLRNQGLFKNDDTWNLLELGCIFVQKEFIFESREAIINNMQKIFSLYLSEKATTRKIKELKTKISQIEKKEDVIFALLSTWIALRFERLYYDFDKDLNVNRTLDLTTREWGNRTKEITAHIIPICLGISTLLLEPLKFFFSRGSNSYKGFINQYVILSCRKDCKEKDLSDYERKKYLEVVLLVMKEISFDQKLVMLSHHYVTLLKWTLDTWPYQDLFLKIFGLSSFFKPDVTQFLVLVAEKDNADYIAKRPIKRDSYRSIFRDLWEKTSKDIKGDPWSYPHHILVDNFLKSLNFRSLRILMDTEKFEYHGLFLFELTLKGWLVKENNGFFLINKFFEEAFSTDESRESFKKILKKMLLNDFIRSANVTDLDKLCTWLSESNQDEREKMKNEINAIDAVLSILKYDNSHLADNFLNWLYDSQDKIEDVKKHFRSVEVSRKRVLDEFGATHSTWMEMVTKSTNFLNFIFKSEEEIQNFKHNVLLKDESSVLEFALICDDEYYERFSDSTFFPIKNITDFCELSEEKIEDLKKKCIDSIEELMNLFTAKCGFYIVMDQLINWLVKSSGRRQRLIKKLMKTPAAIQMCSKMITLDISVTESEKETIVRFYNKWVKSCKNIPQIKNDVMEITNEKLTEADRAKLSAMFDKLGKGEDVAYNDIVCFAEDESESAEESDDDDSDSDDNYSYNSDSDEIDSPAGYIRDIFSLFNFGGSDEDDESDF